MLEHFNIRTSELFCCPNDYIESEKMLQTCFLDGNQTSLLFQIVSEVWDGECTSLSSVGYLSNCNRYDSRSHARNQSSTFKPIIGGDIGQHIND